MNTIGNAKQTNAEKWVSEASYFNIVKAAHLPLCEIADNMETDALITALEMNDRILAAKRFLECD